MNRILILSERENDLARLILNQCANSAMYSIKNDDIPFDNFDSICILGGTEEESITLPASTRIKVEKIIEEGKPVFAEFVSSIGNIYPDGNVITSHHRIVYSDKYVNFADLKRGDILDGHSNEIINHIMQFAPKDSKPILTYHEYLCAHDHIEMDDKDFKSGKWALWKFNNTTLISSIRVCNFNRARLAPRDSWLKIIQSIIDFLCGEVVNINFPEPICKFNTGKSATCPEDIEEAVLRGLNWYKNANMFNNNGKAGVYEGFNHSISARDGKQEFMGGIRTDCTGETGGAFLLDYLITGNKNSYEIYKNTESFCFDYMQIKSGEHRGMMRWTESAWGVCYQDDVARAILPSLLNQNFGVKSEYFDKIQDALEFMIKTTGEDGIRVYRTDCCFLDDKNIKELQKAGSGQPSAHYNAFYHAVLLLAARAGADKKFADVAVKGLTTMMNIYPDTARETSETEEMCRLVLPLALLYEYTGEREHYEWLCRVVKDLEKVKHRSGGYAEWDTGYKAVCSRNDKGECALLAQNGDPVADLLYSNNWLPLGFAYAYMVTKEEYFYKKWEEIATFLLRCQIQSDDMLLDGAWTRAIDMERMEIYGVPHDVGWAPCCIETGWTVAEILMGLQFMTIAQKYI